MPYHILMFRQVQHMVDDPLIIAFTWCVIIDVVTGYIRSAFVRKTNSTKGLFGLVKHTVVLVSIISIYPYLISLGFDWLAQTMVWGFILNYLTSITENWGEMGLWLPPQIKAILVKLQSDYYATDYNAITGADKYAKAVDMVQTTLAKYGHHIAPEDAESVVQSAYQKSGLASQPAKSIEPQVTVAAIDPKGVK